MSDAKCLICGASGRFYAAKNGCQVHRCTRCDLIFVSPMPADSTAVYQGDYFSGATDGFGYTCYDVDKQPMIPVFDAYLKRISRYISPAPGRRLLDVGAATGFFLNLARQAGWENAGIEPSDSAASMARKKNLDVKTGLLLPGVYPPGSFDVVTLWDVIEHLPDPVSTMNLVRDLLKPGGVLAINTPDASSGWARLFGARWHALCPPEHLALFTTTSMDRLLQDVGFELLERGKIAKSFTVQYILQTLGHWTGSKLLSSVAYKLHTRPIGALRIPLDLRDNCFLLARKRDP